MTEPALAFSPGSLVRARGREWIVLPSAAGTVLRLRPLSGAETDVQVLDAALESDGVAPASFGAPSPERYGTQGDALLLKDALLLSLRRGAGPFRSAGRIGFEPRAYQLVPLLMALKLDIVRLLIADDVGIGKTIEAGLIAREFLDRGEIERCTVLCPPHLVDQWVEELSSKFHIHAIAVTSASASKLERDLPQSERIFDVHPFTVVSLDYVKSDRRRHDFLRACPDFVIVDEAHACTGAGRGMQQRYQLLTGLAEKGERHMVFLTATPHSGDAEAFSRLLGLIDPAFAALSEAAETERRALRERLAANFVQRRRVDIDAWSEKGLFPRHESDERTYRLSGEYQKFFEDVLDYCAEVTERAGTDERRRRLAFWGTLALMRCVASSPAAAQRALVTRANLDADPAEELAIRDRVLDGEADDLNEDDAEPAGAIEEDPRLKSLIDQASSLALATKLARDPKLKLLTEEITTLVGDGFSPVVFCRYIATAKAVAERLRTLPALRGVSIDAVTGELASPDREARVAQLAAQEKRLLVATDCLSEGINLQESFDAVVHYDLSWNPTRHQQREGRVDRFGQPSKKVRSLLLYGENNPVDGAVLNVILRKAEAIRRDTGVPVPLPDDQRRMTEALMQAVLLRRREPGQLTFDFTQTPAAREIDRAWRDASEREKKNRTIFAQRQLKPEEVEPEWEKARSLLGGPAETRRFVERSLRRLRAPLESVGRAFKAPLASLIPITLRERLEEEGLKGTVRIQFGDAPGAGRLHLHRAHPLVGLIAEAILETALDDAADPSDPATLPRCGVWRTRGVTQITTLVLLRIRHRIETSARGKRHSLLAEEAALVAFGADGRRLETENLPSLLEGRPEGDLPEIVKNRQLASAAGRLRGLAAELDAVACERAEVLTADHARVRQAAETRQVRARGAVEVDPVLPPDVIGFYVLLPVVD
jgi:superfamily II DNA or RNA helicase